MKYWVYKESRIHGPFDKEVVSGLPGLDAGTLVCVGDPAGGSSWVPAGELDGLTRAAPASSDGLLADLPSSMALLDQLQIDTSGLVGDDEFPGALAEELFQDASFKGGFGDALSVRDPASDAEARRARDKISELTAQLEIMYRRISELELSLSRSDASATAPVKTFLSPAAPPIPGGPSLVAAVPETAPPPIEWPEAPPAGSRGLPSLPGGALVPPTPPAPPAPPALPEMPSFSAPAAPVTPAVEPPVAPPAVKPWSFGKPKSFKIVPTMKSFRVLGAEEAVPAATENPVPTFDVVPIIETSAPIPPPVVTPVGAAPVVLAPAPVPAPIPVPAPMSIPSPEPAPITNPFSLPARPQPITAPASPPPNTLSRAQPVPDLASGDLVGASDATMQAPPATMARAEDALAARFAKQEPAPPTGEIKKPARSNKAFLIGGGVLVTMLTIVGVIFMRQPKDDLKQMTTLDDGKAPIGLSADESAPPPIVKPVVAEPAPPPGPSAEHAAAISAVKDFPLDGGRGTVGRWLQYSYTASPDAGAEEWNASATGENTMLVEYRLVPSATGGRGALYLFEVAANGLVIGKNIEARQMLAGGPSSEAPKTKKPVKKSSRRAVRETLKEVPLLPLPDSGELRPPAEDDGTFGSDTINSGI